MSKLKNNGSNGDYTYRVFISYAHKSSMPLALALKNQLPRFGRSRFSRRGFSVFLDQDGMRTGGTLWRNIEKNLSSSKYLLLIASPEARRSKWVNEEAKWWLENRSLDRLIIVLGVKESTVKDVSFADNVPPVLSEVFVDDEPLIHDFSTKLSTLDFSSKSFRAILGKLVGTLDDLSDEEIQERNNASEIAYRRDKRLVKVAALVIIVLVLSTAFSIFEINRQRELGRLQEQLVKTEQSSRLASESKRQINISPRTSIISAIQAGAIADTIVSRESLRSSVSAPLPYKRLKLGNNIIRVVSNEYPSPTKSMLIHDDGWQQIEFHNHTSTWKPTGKKYQSNHPISRTYTTQNLVVVTEDNRSEFINLLNYPEFGQQKTIRINLDSYKCKLLGITPDASLLAIPKIGHQVELINLKSPTLATKTIQTDIIYPCWGAFSPDMKTFAVAGRGTEKIQLIDLDNTSLIQSIPDQKLESLEVMKWAPDSKVLFAGDINGTLHIWRFADGTVLKQERSLGTGIISDMIFTSDGLSLVVSSVSRFGQNDLPGSLSLIDISNNNFKVTQNIPFDIGLRSLSWLPVDPINLNEAVKEFASVTTGGQVHLWKIASGQISAAYPELVSATQYKSPKLIYNSKDNLMYLATGNGRIISFDKNGNSIKEIYNNKNRITDAEIYADRLFWLGEPQKLYSLRLDSNLQVNKTQLPNRLYNSLEINVKTQKIYAIANVGSIDIVDMEGQAKSIMLPPDDWFTSSFINHDADEMLFGTAKGVIYRLVNDHELVNVAQLFKMGEVKDIKVLSNGSKNKLLVGLYSELEKSSATLVLFKEGELSPMLIKDLELDSVTQMIIDPSASVLTVGGSYVGRGRILQFNMQNLEAPPVIGDSRDIAISSLLYSADQQLFTAGRHGVIENWGASSLDLHQLACNQLSILESCSAIKEIDNQVYQLCSNCP